MINALLVRWSKGWHEVTDAASIAAHGRHEALLGLGAVESVEELERIAGRQLDAYGTVREEIAGNLAPVGAADTPYIAFEVGDTIGVPASDGSPSQERVTALTVAEDENGQLTWVPELRDVLLTQAERLEQGLKKMADGTLGGESRVATPTGQITTQAPIVKAATSVQPPVVHANWSAAFTSADQLSYSGTDWLLYETSLWPVWENVGVDTGVAWNGQTAYGAVVEVGGLYLLTVGGTWSRNDPANVSGISVLLRESVSSGGLAPLTFLGGASAGQYAMGAVGATFTTVMRLQPGWFLQPVIFPGTDGIVADSGWFTGSYVGPLPEAS